MTHVTGAKRNPRQGFYGWVDDSWEQRAGRSWRDPGCEQTDDDPAVCLSWNDAQAYALKDRFEAGQINSVQFLKELLEIAKETLQAEKETPPQEDEDRGKAAMTQLLNDVKSQTHPSSLSGS